MNRRNFFKSIVGGVCGVFALTRSDEVTLITSDVPKPVDCVWLSPLNAAKRRSSSKYISAPKDFEYPNYYYTDSCYYVFHEDGTMERRCYAHCYKDMVDDYEITHFGGSTKYKT